MLAKASGRRPVAARQKPYRFLRHPNIRIRFDGPFQLAFSRGPVPVVKHVNRCHHGKGFRLVLIDSQGLGEVLSGFWISLSGSLVKRAQEQVGAGRHPLRRGELRILLDRPLAVLDGVRDSFRRELVQLVIRPRE